MLTLNTYRSRLVIYIALLLLFLVSILLYSYLTTRSTLLKEADRSMNHTANLLAGQLASSRNELQRYARIVHDDLRIREYMFVVVSVSYEVEPLKNLYKQQFGWLPVDRIALLDKHGKLLIGDDEPGFINKIRQKINVPTEQTFTYKGKKYLELVTLSPVYYRDELLGFVALSNIYNSARLSLLRQNSGGDLFIVENHKIQSSTVANTEDEEFAADGNHAQLGNDYYRVHTLDMPDMEPGSPQLWLGISEHDLTSSLNYHMHVTLVMIILGCLFILALGILVIRNFTQPLVSLMTLTSKIASGELPRMGKTIAKNEIEHLANQFADMLQGLREKQEEIDRVHKQLEDLATTDSLTGLYNRRYLQDLFPKLEAQIDRDNKILGMTLCDLDHFKRINDRYGHLAGDYCLQHFSWLTKKYLRENDFVIRMGGEEFLILSLTDDINGHLVMAEKIRMAIQNDRVNFEGEEIKMTVSCGISTSDRNHKHNLNALLSQADMALYQAKSEGRNQVKLYNDNSRNNYIHPRAI
jgi:diguanylate cyclase (GGDEF)-like protein